MAGQVKFEDTREALERATASVEPARKGAIFDWIRLLCEWNARIDLTAARTGGELVDLMLADAMTLAARIPQGVSVLDVGTGAGAPGLALALLRPDLAVTLCEPLTKRVSFLRTVLGTVNRADVKLVRSRGEDLPGAWDVATSRATLAPHPWATLGTKLAKDVWVFLAHVEAPLVDGASAVEDAVYEWPETKVAVRAVRYRVTVH